MEPDLIAQFKKHGLEKTLISLVGWLKSDWQYSQSRHWWAGTITQALEAATTFYKNRPRSGE